VFASERVITVPASEIAREPTPSPRGSSLGCATCSSAPAARMSSRASRRSQAATSHASDLWRGAVRGSHPLGLWRGAGSGRRLDLWRGMGPDRPHGRPGRPGVALTTRSVAPLRTPRGAPQRGASSQSMTQPMGWVGRGWTVWAGEQPTGVTGAKGPRDGKALRDHPRRGLQSRQPHRRVARRAARVGGPHAPLHRQGNFAEVQLGLDESNALFEARRCLSCGNCFECDNCYGVCPDNAVIKLATEGRYAIDYDYCKGCGLCVQECPCGAIEMEPEPS
jgi:2-oxoacid:acceptor oxidoreductase delta subunit (pyruvate/2-ketoisovalerate family)